MKRVPVLDYSLTDLANAIIDANYANQSESYDGARSNFPYDQMYNPPDTYVGDGEGGRYPAKSPNSENTHSDGTYAGPPDMTNGYGYGFP